MKRRKGIICYVVLTCACMGVAQGTKQSPIEGGTRAAHVQPDGQGLEVLSDTQGVDFKPYLKAALHDVYAQWVELMPEGARKQTEKGVTVIRFAISPDGTIATMHLEGSAHDDALNRAAWGAITGVGKFAPLPSAFHGPDLELRIHFAVND